MRGSEPIFSVNVVPDGCYRAVADNDRLQHEIGELKKQVLALEEESKVAVRERQERQKSHDAALKQKDVEIRLLDMQVHKPQTSLDSTARANDQLKTDIKSKTAELSDRVVELEKLSVRYEATIADLNEAKADLKAANKTASEAEKRVSKLEGQLEVYMSLEKKENQ
jgi:chromosome segregation ATPase